MKDNKKPKSDFFYTFDGLLYTLWPNTKQAEDCWNKIYEKSGCKHLPYEFDNIKKQLNEAGYTVRKMSEKKNTTSDKDLLTALGVTA